MAKITEKIGAVLSGWSNLPKLIANKDTAGIRRQLADNLIDLRMVDILLLIPTEAERLQAIIDENGDLGDHEQLDFEFQSLSRFSPRSLEDAAAASRALAEARRKKDRAWFGALERRRAENELGFLQSVFSECFAGTAGKPAATLACCPANLCNAMLQGGLQIEMLLKNTWREAYKLQPATPKRRQRLVAR